MTARDGFELVVFDCDGVLVDSEVIAIRVDQPGHSPAGPAPGPAR